MKTLIRLALILFSTGSIVVSCTEEIFTPVYVNKPWTQSQIDSLRALLRPDTVFKDRILIDSFKVTIPGPTVYMPATNKDSLIYVSVPGKDSLVYVYIHDTTVVREHTYQDTLFVYGGRGYYSVPPPIQKIVTLFYKKCVDYNKVNAPGWNISSGLISISPWLLSENPDPGWSSTGTASYGMCFIKVKDDLTVDEMLTPIWRELARWQMSKRYSHNESEILSPYFNPNTVTYSTVEQHKAEIDQLFK